MCARIECCNSTLMRELNLLKAKLVWRCDDKMRQVCVDFYFENLVPGDWPGAPGDHLGANCRHYLAGNNVRWAIFFFSQMSHLGDTVTWEFSRGFRKQPQQQWRWQRRRCRYSKWNEWLMARFDTIHSSGFRRVTHLNYLILVFETSSSTGRRYRGRVGLRSQLSCLLLGERLIVVWFWKITLNIFR